MSIAQLSQVGTFAKSYEFYRVRTLGLLDRVAAEPDPQRVLAWRPGAGRAHIGWQMMHVAITEDVFASERLAPDKSGVATDLWPRFRFGSTPDDNVPALDTIRQTLATTRANLLDTLGRFGDERLGEIPAALAERKLTIQDVLYILGWHEAHHQGQAHITMNLYKAATA
ncbi:MAG: DinB family protein [Pirellulales bacterium]